MSKVIYKEGSILDATEDYICHQVNAVTNDSAFLAKEIFEMFPYANIYATRTSRDECGTIIVSGNGEDLRYVVGFVSQLYPGKSKYSNDDYFRRAGWFESCLDQLAEIEDLDSVAFPWRIGCGAAGGNWIIYENMIRNFAKDMPDTEVVIYKKK